MKRRLEITDNWTLRLKRRNPFVEADKPIETSIPATVYGVLIEAGLMPEPYIGDNEYEALKLMEGDFVFETEFELDGDILDSDAVSLDFYGLDTLADIVLNGINLGFADNMHRTWRFDVSSVVSEHNRLSVTLHSPTEYIKRENARVFAGGSWDAMEGFPHLRKSHCSFGWDWGQRLPDAGIFRGVEIVGHNRADISELSVYQEHIKTGRGIHGYSIPEVRLHVTTEINVYREGHPVAVGDIESLKEMGLRVETEAVSPDGAVYPMDEVKRGRIMDAEDERGVTHRIRIPDPKLWWPAGYGEQPLYAVRVRLIDSDGDEVLDEREIKTGLRILTVNQDPCPDGGKNFAFKVNGLQIFAMGANYIPEDNIISRTSRERTERLLREAVGAHFNMIRVWGGGYYPDDWFYDLCDELGLIVWQDLMFACANYELNGHFEENILAEISDNVRRLRHHACIGLWCGNNEAETQTLDGAWRPSMKQKSDYIKIFEYLIPNRLRELDPDRCYWPSSPSSGGNFDDPWAENVGDTHCWEVWHGAAPFTAYRKHRYRFVSEFGFQSFPCMDTIRSFAGEGELNIFSRVMELHQRNGGANGRIMSYLSGYLLYPRDLPMTVYASQIMQAQAIRYGVEHFRRCRGTTMGALVWQLNDISPVASWSAIDYFGRRKALYYALRRAFLPVSLTCEEHGELDLKPFVNAEPRPVEFSAKLHVANETDEVFTGRLKWSVRDEASVEVYSGEEDAIVLPYDGKLLCELDLSGRDDFDQLSHHIEYTLYDEKGEEISRGSSLFCAPKHYRFRDPELSSRREGDEIVISASAFAMGVCVMDGGESAPLSDNFFDMEAGERRVRLERETGAEGLTLVSVYDIA